MNPFGSLETHGKPNSPRDLLRRSHCSWCRFLLIFFALVVYAHSQSDPSVVGQWTSIQQFPYIAGHASLLPTGKVLFWPTFSQGDNPQLWDPVSNTVAPAVKAGFNIFCSGHSFVASGKLLVAGGHNGSSQYGLTNASLYDPISGTWTATANMSAPRWYPTNTTLSNGDVLVVSGDIDPSTMNTLPEVWQSSTGTWRELTTAQLLQIEYPRMFLSPNGKVAYVAGGDGISRYLDTSGTGSWSTFATENAKNRDYGNAVLYDAGKILLAGGAIPPIASAEVIDLQAPSPAWRLVSSMPQARRQANATVLPDGKVFISGGSSGASFDDSSHPVYPTVMWDPVTENWTTMASISIYRGYHSTAVLLPDGRVLSAGGEVTGASYEVYSPPYLFKGARPTITSAPGSVGYGDNFFVQTPDAANISQVSWIALSSMTHTMEQNQRFLRLSFTQASGGLNVTAPASGNLSPPGYYMLFIVNSNGVPSVAAMMRQVTAPGAIPADPSNLVASAVSSTQINLTWTDNSNNETGFGIQRSTDGTNFTQIATVGAGVVNYSDAGLPPSTQYFYRVQALGSGGNSAFSNVANATTQAASPLPAAPSNLIGNTVSHSQVNLTWTDNSNNETGFVIQRSTNGATFTQVATVAANVRTFSNTGLSAATFYYYRVAAINSFGSSAYSNVLKVRTKVK